MRIKCTGADYNQKNNLKCHSLLICTCLLLLFILPGASPQSVTLILCAPIRLIIYPTRAVSLINSHPLLPSLCLLVLFLLGIFQLGDFRSKLRQLSGLCTRAQRMGRELGVLLVWVIVLLFTAARVWTGMMRVQMCGRAGKYAHTR